MKITTSEFAHLSDEQLEALINQGHQDWHDPKLLQAQQTTTLEGEADGGQGE